MPNTTKEPSWFGRNKQTVILTIAVLLLIILAGTVVYFDATRTMHLT